MKVMQKSLLALIVLATTALNVQAASNVDVKVIGRIDPGTCTPTLSGGGTVDYGTMSPSILAATGYTLLPKKQLDFSIVCTAASKVAIRAVNGKPNTLAGATEGASGSGQAPVTLFGDAYPGAVGLGKSGNANIGGYQLQLTQSTIKADGSTVDGLYKADSQTAWTNGQDAGDLYAAGYSRTNTWAATGTKTPIAFTTLTGKLAVQPYLNQKSALDLTNTIMLDGLTTLELVYLP